MQHRQTPKILVVGSLVMDLITSTAKIPSAGETVIGCGFSSAPGGKGANQACQAARLGAQVSMVGKVGGDMFGQALIDSLAASGVDVTHIAKDPNSYSAIGNVQLLQQDGKTLNNRIIVAPGANYRLPPEDLAFLEHSVRDYDIVMLQLEIPLETNIAVARWAAAAGVPVMLNPAPSAPLPQELLSCLTYISPNEHEAADLTGIRLTDAAGQLDSASIAQALKALHGIGVPQVLITLGSQGSILSSQAGQIQKPCVPGVNAIDPTAAGDSFVAAFCVAAAAGMEQEDALTLATHTAALTVSALGAQPSLPYLSQVIRSLQEHSGYCQLAAEVEMKLGGTSHESP